MRILQSHVPIFSRFVLVGATTAFIYFAVFALLNDLLGIRYELAVSCAYAMGVIFHFLANRQLTFKAEGGHVSVQVIRYAFVAALNYVVTLAVVALAVEVLGFSPYLGVLAAVMTTTLVGYGLFGRWVFRSQRADGALGR